MKLNVPTPSFDDLVDVRSFEEASVRNRLPFSPLQPGTVRRYAITLAALVNYTIKLQLNHPGDAVVPRLTEAEAHATQTYVANPVTATAADLVLALFGSPARDRGASTVAWFVRLRAYAQGTVRMVDVGHIIVHLIYAIR